MKKLQLIAIAILTIVLFAKDMLAQDPVSIGRTELEPGSGIWLNNLYLEAQTLYHQDKIYEAAAKFIESANYEANSEHISWQCWELSLHMSGSIYYTGEYWQYAIDSWKLLLDRHYQTQSWENYVRLGQSLGACYMYSKQYQESINTFTNLWKLFEMDTNKDAPMGLSNRAAMLKSIGVAYEEWMKYDSAHHYYKKSLELNKRANNQEETTRLTEYVDRVSKKL